MNTAIPCTCININRNSGRQHSSRAAARTMLITTLEREMARRTASSSRMLRHGRAAGRSGSKVRGRGKLRHLKRSFKQMQTTPQVPLQHAA